MGYGMYSFGLGYGSRRRRKRAPLPDTTPDAYSWTPVVGAPVDTVVEAGPIQFTGLEAPTNFYVTGVPGAEVIVLAEDGVTVIRDWSTDSAEISNLQWGNVRFSSSPLNSTERQAFTVAGGISAPFSVTTEAATDTVPDAFSFSAVTGASLSTNYETALVQITGFDSAPISISGHETAKFQIWDTTGTTLIVDWTSAPNTVLSNQRVKARVTSAGNYETLRSATLDIGGVTATFDVTTMVEGAADFTAFDDAEVAAIMLANDDEALSGAVMRLTGPSYGRWDFSNRHFTTPFVIYGDRTAVVERIDITNCKKLTLQGFKVYDLFQEPVDGVLIDNGSTALIQMWETGTEDIILDGLEICSRPIAEVTMQAAIMLPRGITMYDRSVGDIIVRNCEFHDLSRGAFLRADRAYVLDCTFEDLYVHNFQFGYSREMYWRGGSTIGIWANGSDQGNSYTNLTEDVPNKRPHMSLGSFNPYGLKASDGSLFEYVEMIDIELDGAPKRRFDGKGDGKYGGASGPKFNDMPPTFMYGRAAKQSIIRNVRIICADGNGLQLGDTSAGVGGLPGGGCKNFLVENVTCLRWDDPSGVSLVPNILVQESEDVIIRRCTARQIVNGPTNKRCHEFDNWTMHSPLDTTAGIRGYANALTGPTWGYGADTATAFSRRVGGPLDGSVKIGYAPGQTIPALVMPTKSTDAGFAYPGVAFDAGQYAIRTDGLCPDSKAMTIIFVIEPLADGTERYILAGPSSRRIRCFGTASGTGVEIAFKAGSMEVVNFRTFNHLRVAGGLQLFAIAFDLETGKIETLTEGVLHDGVQINTMVNSTMTNSTGTWYLMTQTPGVKPFPANLHLFAVYPTFISLKDNLASLINVSNQPVDMGINGANLGTAARWATGDAATWMAGIDGWTIAGGTVTDAGAPDVTPPVLAKVSTGYSGVTATGATLTFSTNEPGTVHYVVTAAAAPAPDGPQIVAGTDGGDAAPLVADTDAVAAAGAINLAVTGLPSGTACKAYAVQEDPAGNFSAVVATDEFTTAAASGYVPVWIGFDGTTNYLTRASKFTGVVEGQQGTIFVRCKAQSGISNLVRLVDIESRTTLRRAAGNNARLTVLDSGGATLIDVTTTGGNWPVDVDTVIHAEWNTEAGQLRCRITVGGVTENFDGSVTAGIGDFDRDLIGLAGNTAGSVVFKGSIADLCIEFGAARAYAGYLDGEGDPVNPGTVGSPQVHYGGGQSLASWQAGTNQKSGGDCVVHGTLTAAA